MAKSATGKLPYVLLRDGLAQIFYHSGKIISQDEFKATVELAKRRCVEVRCRDVKQSGTGVRIGGGRVLTCWHIRQLQRNKSKIGEVMTVERMPALIVHERPEYDLMLLQTSPDDLPSIELASEVSELDPVFWVGNPLDFKYIVHPCTVIGVRRRRLYISDEIQVGTSGAGLYQYNGHLAGILYQYDGKPSEGKLSCAKPVNIISKFLLEAPASEQTG